MSSFSRLVGGDHMRELFKQCTKYSVHFYSPDERLQIATKICTYPPQYLPCDLLHAVKKQKGPFALLAADVILFGWCFAATLLLDLYSAHLLIYGEVLGFFCCIAAFCLCRDNWYRSMLKLCYLVYSFICGDSWFITACFMLVFEHITFNHKMQRSEPHAEYEGKGSV